MAVSGKSNGCQRAAGVLKYLKRENHGAQNTHTHTAEE